MIGRNAARAISGIILGITGMAALAASQERAPAPPPPTAGAPVQGAPAQSAPPARGGAPSAPTLPPLTPAAIERAKPILEATRQALGGEKLAAVKSLNATGRTRRVRGNNLVPIEFEMDFELPDKYVRKDEFPAEETDPTSSGFNGNDLIQNPAPAALPARAGAPAPPPGQAEQARAARVRSVKQDFVRFALGMFASSFETYPLTFGYAAEAKAPQGTAHVLDVRGEGGFALRFFVQSETNMPIMVSWNLPPTNVIVTVPGQPAPATVAPGAVVITGPAMPPASAAKEEKDQYAKDVLALQTKARATPVEHRIYFADYRDVDGVKLPFRLRRAIGTDTTEETTIDRYRLNTRIAPQKFAVAK